MKVDEKIWKIMQKRLGCNNEEMKKFREDRRNEDVLSKGPALMSKTIIVEIVESHGCNSRHKAGDKFYFDGAGNLAMPFSDLKEYLMASTGQTFKQRAQLKQSAGIFFPSTLPFAASEGHFFTQTPHCVHLLLSIRTRKILSRSVIHEMNPKGQII